MRWPRSAGEGYEAARHGGRPAGLWRVRRVAIAGISGEAPAGPEMTAPENAAGLGQVFMMRRFVRWAVGPDVSTPTRPSLKSTNRMALDRRRSFSLAVTRSALLASPLRADTGVSHPRPARRDDGTGRGRSKRVPSLPSPKNSENSSVLTGRAGPVTDALRYAARHLRCPLGALRCAAVRLGCALQLPRQMPRGSLAFVHDGGREAARWRTRR